MNPIKDYEIPANLIFPESEIKIDLAQDVFLNNAKSSIVISGSRNGFLSLANSLIYLVNTLQSTIDISRLSFVQSHVSLVIEIDDTASGVINGIVKKKGRNFAWMMSEDESNAIFTGIHSLGNINPELHLDEGKTADEISVYCVVN